MLIIGHRGAMGYITENTIYSVQKALDLKVDMIEIDVQASANGDLFVFHDRRLERLTNQKGVFTDLDTTNIKALVISDNKTVPSLRDILNLIKEQVTLNIEIKSKGVAKPLGLLLNRYIKEGSWEASSFIISSFDHQELSLFKTLYPNYNIGALLYHLPNSMAAIGNELDATSIHCSIDFITEEFVIDAHNRSLKVYCYTVNHQNDYDFCKKIGVDGIFTNYPDIFKSL